MIKQFYELELVNTVFKIQPNKADSFFCFLLFVQSFNCLYLWNHLPNLCGVFTKLKPKQYPNRKCQKTKILFFDFRHILLDRITFFSIAFAMFYTLLKQTIEKSIYKDCGEGKILIRLKIQSWRLNFQTNFNQICIRIQSLRLNFQSY